MTPDTTNPARHPTRGRIWVVNAPKVGVGATTLVANLAIELATTLGRRVALVDLDLECGDLAMMLDLEAVDALGDLLAHAQRADPLVLHGTLARHASGVDVLTTCPPPPGTDRPPLPADQVVGILDRLAATYDVVLVDAPPPLTAAGLAALGRADRVIVAMELTVPCVRAAWRTLAALAVAGVERHVVMPVATKCATGASGLTAVDVGNALGVTLARLLPRDDAAERAVNAGCSLAAIDPKSPLRRGIVALARALAADAAEQTDADAIAALEAAPTDAP
jgi:pilus assembly protein CpaE